MNNSKGSITFAIRALSDIGEPAAEQLAKPYGISRWGMQAGVWRFELLPLRTTSGGSPQAAGSEMEQRELRIDLLVNNAGFAQDCARRRRRSWPPAAST